MKYQITKNDVADAITQRPESFSIDGRIFNVYPVTLGKTLMLGKLYETMGLNAAALEADPSKECLRLVGEHLDTVCRVIVYVTTDCKYNLFNLKVVNERINYIKAHAEPADIAVVLQYILTMAGSKELQDFLGITKEREREAKILRCKSQGSSISVGGVSIYGTLIDAACERYGWTMDYVVWGISLTNLETMLADKVNSIYLTADEAKKCPVSRDGVALRADDPRNYEAIKRILNH